MHQPGPIWTTKRISVESNRAGGGSRHFRRSCGEPRRPVNQRVAAVNSCGLLTERARDFAYENLGYEPNPDGSKRTPVFGLRNRDIEGRGRFAVSCCEYSRKTQNAGDALLGVFCYLEGASKFAKKRSAPRSGLEPGTDRLAEPPSMRPEDGAGSRVRGSKALGSMYCSIPYRPASQLSDAARITLAAA